jgi:hypothetical protein
MPSRACVAARLAMLLDYAAREGQVRGDVVELVLDRPERLRAFQPTPLFRVLARLGFACHIENFADDDWS